MRSKVVPLVLASMTVTCGAEPRPDSIADSPPDDGCSELMRVIDPLRGLEEQICGGAPVEERELISLGEGYLYDWAPASGRNRLWKVAPDGTLGDGPLMVGDLAPRAGHLLYSLGGRAVLDAQPRDSSWAIFTANLDLRVNGGLILAPRVKNDAWPGSELFWGYESLSLDDDHLLKWRPGSGQYAVLSHDRATHSLLPTSFAGTTEALKRGARIANLGSHRLLEWIPHTGDYRIWVYGFEDGRPEIFVRDAVDAPPTPVFQGRWGDVGKEHELLVVDRDRILAWRRTDGEITVRALDPLGADPLGGAVLGRRTYARLASLDWNAPATSPIENVVIVLQRGRSFDSYFGRYCTAPPGSNPTCSQGPDCCEAMPVSIPGAESCAELDAMTDAHAPRDSAACYAAKMNGGAMDGYATAPGCGDARDFACTPTGERAGAFGLYHQLAAVGALGDRFFQTTIDGDAINAELNAIYLSSTKYGLSPANEGGLNQLTHLLAQAGVRYALYLDDPTDPQQTFGQDPPAFYDAHWTHYRWLGELARDIALEQLPAVSVVAPPPRLTQQAGRGPAQGGIEFTRRIVETILASPRYQRTALTLVAFLTSGGYFDHVAPPPPPRTSIDSKPGNQDVPYGPRTPLLALGGMVRPGFVSHVPMELASLVVFLEWNWLNGMVGQLGHRDQTAANIGGLLNPALAVPDMPLDSR